MPPALPPGTFRLHPYAEPPLRAGSYTLTGEVGGMPGAVRTMASKVDVVAPRFTLPPDQILGTFPPAGARGSFTSRLPQIVMRRRTLPWERSLDLEAATAPTPWLALVLIAEGEAQLLSDVDVAQCVSAGVTLTGERDVPKSSCLEVPEEVVQRTFPTVEDLRLLAHVRAVDIADTELAMGDDDGWLAVVMGNRLPQPGVRYLVCLISVEGQLGRLPTVTEADLELSYISVGAVLNLHAEAAAAYGPVVAHDTAVMRLPGSGRPERDVAAGDAAAAAAPTDRVFVRDATGRAAQLGAEWAAAPSARAPTAAYSELAAKARRELADGWAIDLGVVVRPMLRFPVLAYWSFQCEERGDFQYLAEHVHVRLLGHVPEGPETPDGDPVGAAPPPAAGNEPEPPPARPLPLVTETGHVELDHASRAGEPAPAWFRGPATPLPVPRAALRDDGRPPLAHHADQLRRVVPDGREDLGYAAAFEIGRLLALSQPGVVSALARWRQEAYGAARVQESAGAAVAGAPDEVREAIDRPDVLTEDTRAKTAGSRALRAVTDALGADGAARVGAVRPVADPSQVARDLGEVLGDRDETALTGLGVEAAGAGSAEELLGRIATEPPRIGRVDIRRTRAALRQTLEEQAAQLASAAGRTVPTPGGVPTHLAVREDAPRDALDELLDDAARGAVPETGEEDER
jgi:hypothetical protein